MNEGTSQQWTERQSWTGGTSHRLIRVMFAWGKRRAPLAVLLLLMLCGSGLTGCHSRFVEVTIVNQGPVVQLMEFDYPSASFGANVLEPGAKYHYRFKIQGSGPLSLQYQDASGQTRTSEGPKVDLGEEGSLLVNIDARGTVTWTPTLTNRQ